MAEKTLQKIVFEEIKKQSGTKLNEIAEKLDITRPSMSDRMKHNITLKNFWEMLQVCGYSINIYKTPENEENSINVGKMDCRNCTYKILVDEMDSKFKYFKEQIDKEDN